MNRLQIRLLHQLIEEEFKELRAISKGHFMQIVKKGADPEEEVCSSHKLLMAIWTALELTFLFIILDILADKTQPAHSSHPAANW